MGDRVNVSGDPAWAGFASNLVSLFDPKVSAEAEALRARRTNWEADARKSGLEADAVALRLAALREMPIGMNPIAYWAAKAASASTPESIVGGNTRQGAFDSMMGGTAEAARRANNYLHGMPTASAGPSGILTVSPLTGAATVEPTPYSQSIVAENQAKANQATAYANAKTAGAGVKAPSKGTSKSTGSGATDERKPFTPEQLVGPVRQSIVDLFHAGSTENKDFTTLDEGMIRRISDTAQSLVSTGVSTRSSALADAFKVIGLSTDAKAENRFNVKTETTPGGWTGDDKTKVVGITPIDQPDVFADDLTSRLIASGEIVPEAVGEKPIHVIPVEQIRDALPAIRDQAGIGDRFRIGNRVYQKVQMQDGSTALQAIM